jgi:hypothetical protein
MILIGKTEIMPIGLIDEKIRMKWGRNALRLYHTSFIL